MTRLEKLNKIVERRNLKEKFEVCIIEHVGHGKYTYFTYYNDYTSFKINEGRCLLEDMHLTIMDYEEIKRELESI